VLKELSMRESGCMVLSVLRDNEFITNPKADLRFRDGDTVWIAGEKESCEFFR
jgi:K+/H+ antiporter YhaU regulatory subunit KhtT